MQGLTIPDLDDAFGDITAVPNGAWTEGKKFMLPYFFAVACSPSVLLYEQLSTGGKHHAGIKTALEVSKCRQIILNMFTESIVSCLAYHPLR